MGKLTSIAGGGQKGLYNGSDEDGRDQALDAVQFYAHQILITAWEAKHPGEKIAVITIFKDDQGAWTSRVETEGDR